MGGAQIRFEVVSKFKPLPEARFKHIVTYASGSHKFNFILKPQQTSELVHAFMQHNQDRIKR